MSEPGVIVELKYGCNPHQTPARLTFGGAGSPLKVLNAWQLARDPFRDNIDRAHRTGVRSVAHAGQALRNDDVTQAINEYGMVEVQTGLRLFTH